MEAPACSATPNHTQKRIFAANWDSFQLAMAWVHVPDSYRTLMRETKSPPNGAL